MKAGGRTLVRGPCRRLLQMPAEFFSRARDCPRCPPPPTPRQTQCRLRAPFHVRRRSALATTGPYFESCLAASAWINPNHNLLRQTGQSRQQQTVW